MNSNSPKKIRFIKLRSPEMLSVFAVFNKYIEHLNQENKLPHYKRMLKTGLVRFFVPALGGPRPNNTPAQPEENKKAIEFLEQIPATKISEISQITDQFFEEISLKDSERRKYRCYFKGFREWAEEQNLCSASDSIKKPCPEDFEQYRLHAPPGQARREWHAKGPGSKSRHGREKKPIYRLGSVKGDYIAANVTKDCDDYSEFRKSGNCRPPTIKKEITHCYQIWGWCHRYSSRKVPFEDLRLTTIIQYSPLIVSSLDYREDLIRWLLDKEQTKEKAAAVAKSNIEFVREFLEFISDNPRSQITYLDTIIAIAKFVYRQEIGTEDYPEARDIPIIRLLYKEHCRISEQTDDTPEAIPYHAKSVPWEEAVLLVEKLRLRAEREYQKPRVLKGTVIQTKRTSFAVERDLQSFLSLAFMVLLPTDRARSYCELQLGKTLVKGIFKDSHFYPVNFDDNSPEAIWYINLKPLDYKTGKAYKEFWAPISNVIFPNGKSLYEYINDWLFIYRERKKPVEHNFFFRGVNDYEPLDSKDWGCRIANLFERELNVPVYPHQLRKMYISYMNAKGADSNVRRATAIIQHHSEEMQEKVYNKLNILERIAPGVKFCLDSFNEIISEVGQASEEYKLQLEEQQKQQKANHQEQIKIGMAQAKARGVHLGRKPQNEVIDSDRSAQVIELYKRGVSLKEISKQLHIGKNTIKRIMEEHEKGLDKET